MCARPLPSLAPNGVIGFCHCSCAKVLLEHGAAADLPSEEDDETALHVASRCALLHHAKLYLQSGADVNRTSVHGETPLGVACASSQDPEVSLDCYGISIILFLAYGLAINLISVAGAIYTGAELRQAVLE